MLVLLLAPTVQARPHPIHFIKTHKLLIATSALFVAADIADTRTTLDVQQRCPACVGATAVEQDNDIHGNHCVGGVESGQQ